MSISQFIDGAFVKIGVAVLLIWWSVWSILDTYLLSFSPWSELVVFTTGVLLLSVDDSVKPDDAIVEADDDEEEGNTKQRRRKKKQEAGTH